VVLPHELKAVLSLVMQQGGCDRVLEEDGWLLNLIRFLWKSEYLQGRMIKCDRVTLLIEQHKAGFCQSRRHDCLFSTRARLKIAFNSRCTEWGARD
jgi:hypothetical protein